MLVFIFTNCQGTVLKNLLLLSFGQIKENNSFLVII